MHVVFDLRDLLGPILRGPLVAAAEGRYEEKIQRSLQQYQHVATARAWQDGRLRLSRSFGSRRLFLRW